MTEENQHLDPEQIKYFKERLSRIFAIIKKKHRENKLKEIDEIYKTAFAQIKEDPKELFDLLLNNLKYADGELFVYNDVLFDLTNTSSVWIEARARVKELKSKIDHECDEYSRELSIKYNKIIDDVVLRGVDPGDLVEEFESEIDINMN